MAIIAPGFPSIEIDIEGEEELVASLNMISASIRDFHEPLRESVVRVVIPSIRENFDAEGRPPWQRLADATVISRGSSGPILNRTGTLRSEATSLENWTIGREEATMTGVSAEYGAFHQKGTRNMPARPFVGLQPEDEVAIVDIFGDWVDRKIAEGGFR